ncbi:MAG: hypothetical protein H6598_07945 [Flavobacteriales bacterium]|nr:hypothetical protein [Flavobacteriales bacterium]
MKKIILSLSIWGVLFSCNINENKTEQDKSAEPENLKKSTQVISGEKVFNSYQLETPLLGSPTISESIAPNIPKGSKLSDVSFIVNDDLESVINFSIGESVYTFRIESMVDNPYNSWADFQFTDLNGDGIEEIILNWYSEDGNNGFEEGFELYQEGLVIINPIKQICVMDEITTYEYMEYYDTGEEDDVHGKMDEDSEISFCRFSTDIIWNNETFKIMLKEQDFEPKESNGNMISGICQLNVYEGSFGYNTEQDCIVQIK